MIFLHGMTKLFLNIILVFIYLFILTPVSFIFRLMGKQFLELKWNPSQPSYWNSRQSEELTREHYRKQY